MNNESIARLIAESYCRGWRARMETCDSPLSSKEWADVNCPSFIHDAKLFLKEQSKWQKKLKCPKLNK